MLTYRLCEAEDCLWTGGHNNLVNDRVSAYERVIDAMEFLLTVKQLE